MDTEKKKVSVVENKKGTHNCVHSRYISNFVRGIGDDINQLHPIALTKGIDNPS